MSRRRQRLNMKLLVILGVAIVVIVVGGIAGAFIYRKTVAATAAREALKFYENQQYAEAIALFPKAVRRKQFANDIELMLTASDAHTKIPVANFTEASKHIGHRIAWLERAIRVNPHDGRALQERMNFGMRLGKELRETSAWDSMYSRTQELVEGYPDLILAYKYRGIAQVNRMGISTANVSASERSQARKDLEVVMNDDKYADDAEVIEYLANWHAVEARIGQQDGESEEHVESLRDEGLVLTAASTERHPGDIKRLMAHIHQLVLCDRTDELTPYSSQLERLISESTDLAASVLVRSLRFLLLHTQVVQMEGDSQSQQAERQVLLERTSALCLRAIDRHPENLLLQVTLADLYVQQQRLEDAAELCKKVWESTLTCPPMEFIMRRTARAHGGLAYLRMRMVQIERIADPTQKLSEIDLIEKQLVDVKDQLGELPSITLIEARIADARNERIKAAQKYDSVLTSTGQSDITTLLRSAQSRLAMGEWGAAAENFEQALRVRPDLYRVRMVVSQLYMRGQKFEKSEEHLKILLNSDFKSPDQLLERLEIELWIRQKAYDRAEQLFETLDLTAYPDTASAIAFLFYQDKKEERARDLMRRTFARHPADVGVALRLIQMLEEQAQQLAILEQCREAGGDGTALDRIRGLVTEDFEMEQVRTDPEADGDDPARKARADYREFADAGRGRKAREALSVLDFNQPKNALILWELFVERTAKKDWKSAEYLATVARGALSGTGADMAEGRFFLGSLNMARGNHGAAVSDLRAGLEKRRIYSAGWRLLGDALLATQEIDAALDAYETALTQRPNSMRALAGVAEARDRRGEADLARAALKTAAEIQPRNYSAQDVYLRYELKHGDPEQVINLRRQFQDDDPSNMANRRALVRALMAAKDLETAARELKTIVDEEGETLDNILVSADLLASTHDSETVEAQLKNYLKNLGDEGELEVYVRVARKLLEIDRIDAAFSVYRQATTLDDPKIRAASREMAARLMRYPDRISESVTLHKELWHSSISNIDIGVAYVQSLIKNKELPEAESVLEQLAKDDQDPTSLRILKAQIASARGDNASAVLELEIAIDKTPRRATLHVALAEMLLASNNARPDDALASLDRAIELDPMLDRARHLKARIYRARGEFNMAIREYEALLRRADRLKDARIELIPLYRATGQLEALSNLLTKSEAIFPGEAIWPRQQAFLAIQEDKLSKALKKMRRAFDLGQTPEILFDLVRLQLKTDKPNEALLTLRENMELIEDQHLLQALRGRAILMTESRLKAIETFTVAIKLTETLAELVQTTNQIVSSLNFKGTAKLVVDAFEAPLPLWVELCVANLEQRASDHEGAAIRLTPLASQIGDLNKNELAFFHHTYALSLHMTRRFEEARGEYENYLELIPRNAMMLNNLAYIVAEHLNDPDEGIKYAEEAMKIQPNNGMIMDTLGRALYLANHHDRALEVLQKAVHQQESGMACFHLAEVLIQLDQEGQAVEWLHKAKKLAEREHDSDTSEKAETLLTQLTPS